MAQMNFNANQVEGDVANFDRLPKGKYPAMVCKTEMCKPNEKGTEQLRIEWEVLEGPCAKRHISTWVTVACANREAVDIGMRFLKNVCESVGLAGFTDTDELCNRPHVIDVGEKKRADGTLDSEVKRCYPAGSTQAGSSAPQSAQPAAPVNHTATQPAAGAGAKPAGARPPWMK